MAEFISKRNVSDIAHLARLHLQDDAIEILAKDLENILHYIHKLTNLDVSGIEPTSHVLPLQNVYRHDVIQPSLPQSKVLSIAVEQENGFFKVPQIIE